MRYARHPLRPLHILFCVRSRLSGYPFHFHLPSDYSKQFVNNNETSSKLQIPSKEASPSSLQPQLTSASRQPAKGREKKGKGKAIASPLLAAQSDGSATELDSADDASAAVPKNQQHDDSDEIIREGSVRELAVTPHQENSDSDSSSSPLKPPSKKAKVRGAVSNDTDSDANVAPPADTRKRAPVRTGVRQPMKRGGRKF
jgi:hypothetical protein